MPNAKKKPTVYLVEDFEEVEGRILAVFNSKDDANLFANMMEYQCCVVERTVHYGQPDYRGYNK